MRGLETITLEDGDVSVKMLTLGCITQSWRVPYAGPLRHVVLGYPDPKTYLTDRRYMGIIAGRVANRIAKSQFELDGKTIRVSANEGPNSLHGGTKGLGGRIWTAERDGKRAVRFTYHSPDGEEGYPGNVDFAVTVTLDKAMLTYDMEAYPDRPTPIALAQHNYYNLAGGGDVLDHSVWFRASNFTETDDALLPTGKILPVAGTILDFTVPRTFGKADPQRLGADDNFVVDAGDGPVAEVSAPNGPTMRMWSDQKGLQLYSGRSISGNTELHLGQILKPYAGFALEPQNFPDAVNISHFPSPIVTPEQPYRQVTRVEIA